MLQYVLVILLAIFVLAAAYLLRYYRKPHRRERLRAEVSIFSSLPVLYALRLLRLLPKSKSQLRQDLFFLSELGFKKGGYFVEIGAVDGIKLSNTFLLENQFKWEGIVAEPAKAHHERLLKNRHCHIDLRCVWERSNDVLTFNQTVEPYLSTLDRFSDKNEEKKGDEKYDVNTISLVDLLDEYNAPKDIDYLSIDTEGSEFSILSEFNFDKYRFRVITCEARQAAEKDKIYNLLSSKGYVRKFENLSSWDVWHVKA